MIEKIRPVRNPLTIIGIFAAIAEVSGIGILPLVDSVNQLLYVQFLVFFPTLLIILFFLTLNFNHKVLYAPSDYKDESNFIKTLFKPASPIESIAKFLEQVPRDGTESLIEDKSNLNLILKNADTQHIESPPSISKIIKTTYSQIEIYARYFLAENLVINKIAKEMGTAVHREMRFAADTGKNIVFDGVAIANDKVTAIEIKYLHGENVQNFSDKQYVNIINSIETLPKSIQGCFSLIFAIVVDSKSINTDKVFNNLYSLTKNRSFPITIRIFNFQELEQEFESSL